MIVAIADNIISPLGVTTAANADACLDGGVTALRMTADPFSVPGRLPLALLDGDRDATRLAVRSASAAIDSAGIDASDPRTVFIVSTTKAGIPADDSCRIDGNPCDIATTLAGTFGNPNTPVTVSNACVSGVSAQITAMQLIETGLYDTAVIVGVDTLSRFIISGFMSFRALSDDICRPFDANRRGLNLGEAAATIILQRRDSISDDDICLIAGSTHNDANHISGPSRTGEGSYAVLTDLLAHTSLGRLSFVNPHGTATVYNDEMESIALHRAGLDDVPLTPLKDRYGHTLGAAGVLETVLSCEALRRGVIYGSRRHTDSGVTHKMNIAADTRRSEARSFIKLISGFGGVNAGVLYSKGNAVSLPARAAAPAYTRRHTLSLTPQSLICDGITTDCPDGSDTDFVTQIYKRHIGDAPKFYKMDRMTRLGFAAADLLMRRLPGELRPQCSVSLFNSRSSYAADSAYCDSIREDCYYPAPALFVYTLPNIVTGEIAIRHRITGATCFYLLPDISDRDTIDAIVNAGHHRARLYGTLEWTGNSHYHCNLTLEY